MTGTIPRMARKPPKDAPAGKSRYPSRDKIKYVGIPVVVWEELEKLADADDRSVAYLATKACKEFLERHKNKSEQ